MCLHLLLHLMNPIGWPKQRPYTTHKLGCMVLFSVVSFTCTEKQKKWFHPWMGFTTHICQNALSCDFCYFQFWIPKHIQPMFLSSQQHRKLIDLLYLFIMYKWHKSVGKSSWGLWKWDKSNVIANMNKNQRMYGFHYTLIHQQAVFWCFLVISTVLVKNTQAHTARESYTQTSSQIAQW